MAKTKAKNAKKCKKRTKKPPKVPLRNEICGVRTGVSRATRFRDAKKAATPNEVIVAKAIEQLRKKFPLKKRIGRQNVYKHLKGKLSMAVVSRLLSKKGGRDFPGCKRVYPDSIKRHWEEAAVMREQGNFIELSQNTCCRVSRKANWS